MGNGNNRNKRGGARTRHGPHRGGGGNGANRNALHLMPPQGLVREAPAAELMSATEGADDDDATLEQAEAAEVAEEIFEGRAGELHGGPQALPPDSAPGVEVAAASAAPHPEPEPTSEPRASITSAVAPEAPEALDIDEPAPEPERPAPRGRFERFYAPGQGPRLERNGASRSVGSNGSGPQRPQRETPATYPAAPAVPPAPAAAPSAQAPATPPVQPPASPQASPYASSARASESEED